MKILILSRVFPPFSFSSFLGLFWKIGKLCLWGILYSCQTPFMFESSTEGRCQKEWNSTECPGNVNISLSLPLGLVCPHSDSPWNFWHWDLSSINNYVLCKTDSSCRFCMLYIFKNKLWSWSLSLKYKHNTQRERDVIISPIFVYIHTCNFYNKIKFHSVSTFWFLGGIIREGQWRQIPHVPGLGGCTTTCSPSLFFAAVWNSAKSSSAKSNSSTLTAEGHPPLLLFL